MVPDNILQDILASDPVVMIDVGARNGTFELPGLARFIHAYGFEPNDEEYKKLLTGQTDAYKASGVKPPAYAKIRFSPTALGHRDGKQMLYLTKGAGACSLMKPNLKITSEYESDWAWNFEIVGSQEVNCCTLETALREFQLDTVDYIKLDTQGNEFDILFASAQSVNRISVVKTEVEFVEVYENQRLFSDMDAALRKAGFHFVDLIAGPDHRKGRNQPNGFHGSQELIWADAYYARQLQPEEIRRRPTLALKQALVLMELGYAVYGFHLLRKLAAAAPNIQFPIEKIKASYQNRPKTWKQRIPVPIKTMARKLYRKIAG